MLTRIHIEGFKGFKNTEIMPLRKVNLILGGQNVGKTSLLEAVYLGASPVDQAQNLPGVFRLAEGRDMQRFLEMTFKGVEGRIWLDLGAGYVSRKMLTHLDEESSNRSSGRSLITYIDAKEFVSMSGADFYDLVTHGIGFRQSIDSDGKSKRISELTSYESGLFCSPLAIPVNPPSQAEAVRLLDQVVLKRKKRTLLEALRRIEPRLEDIHSLSPDGEQRVYLELDGLPTAVPLPQLGHGFSRLLHLYCSLLVTKAKLALMDEVENGVHYASLPILFQGVHDMAATQGVQTLMTTHSWDCIRAAYQTFADADALQDFQLIRLEREGDNVRAVVMNDELLDTVMEAGYEVR